MVEHQKRRMLNIPDSRTIFTKTLDG